MILYDPGVTVNYQDYGIMLPIAPDRVNRVLEFLRAQGKCFISGANSENINNKNENAFPALDFSAARTLLGLNETDCALNSEDLERVHSKEYIDALYGNGIEAALLKTFELIDEHGNHRRYEPDRAVKPLSDLFRVLAAQAGGTYLACLLALETPPHGTLADTGGFCYYLGGGMHHARYDSGSGFCLINDVAAAAFKLTALKKASHIWIIDMDAHKGDGSAELVQFARDRGVLRLPGGKHSRLTTSGDKPSILTLSIHMAQGWPLDKDSLALAEKGRAPLIPSDVDIGIDSGMEAEYTPRLAEGIKKLEALCGDSHLKSRPDFAIVVDGADPYEHDGLASSGLLRLTLDQCIERDNFIYNYLKERKIPSAWIQSGGYGERAWEPSAHFLKSVFKNA